MQFISEFRKHSLRPLWTTMVLSVVILGGCSRDGGERAARSSNADTMDRHAEEDSASATMRQETQPETEFAAASEASEAPEPMPVEAASRPPAVFKRSPSTISKRASKTRSREMIPEVATVETSPSFDSVVMESSAAPMTEAALPMDTLPQLSQLPAGSERNEEGFATVRVFYATDRQRGALPLSSYQVTGQKQAFMGLGACALLLIGFSAYSSIRGRTRMAAMSAMMGGITACMAAAIMVMGQANIEKHGATYTGDRGTLTRGVCVVTVPDVHQRGMVERPSLLRFEVRENQQKHIVLTSAIELEAGDFQSRLAATVSESPDRDLLVFIHGYNVSFESAVQRTAQMAVDLPFEGVPVCYSWPSQGSLLGYSIDENNSQWTVAHLEQFLLELAEESGADSINVVAHSMGNRAMTAAMQKISWQLDDQASAPFDRIVLAAPDVDADHFRRDLAPSLLNVANQITLYASSDDQALIASKQVHGYPRAGESGANIVVVSGIETVDVSGIDLSLLGHSYYGDNESMLRDLYEVVRARLPAPQRASLITRRAGPLVYWKLAQRQGVPVQPTIR